MLVWFAPAMPLPTPHVVWDAGEAEEDLSKLCERVLGTVLPRRNPSDDVALLAVRPSAVAADALRLSLPAEPESLALLRRRLERFLHAVGADELIASVRDRGHWRDRRGEHRGRGIKIIRGLMDDVNIESQNGGTVVTMRRRLAHARAA